MIIKAECFLGVIVYCKSKGRWELPSSIAWIMQPEHVFLDYSSESFLSFLVEPLESENIFKLRVEWPVFIFFVQ